MKKITTGILLFMSAQYSSAQNREILNEGGATEQKYFSILPYESILEELVVHVLVNGKPYRFILDTGAPTTISHRLFNELKPVCLNKMPFKTKGEASDSLSVVALKEVILGDIHFRDIPALVAPQSFMFDCFRVDGFIGGNLLRNSIVQFSDIDKSVTITNDTQRLNLQSQFSSRFSLREENRIFSRINIKDKEMKKKLLATASAEESLYHFSPYSVFEKADVAVNAEKPKRDAAFAVEENEHQAIQPDVFYHHQKSKSKSNSGQTNRDNDLKMGSKLLAHGVITIDYLNKRFYFDPRLVKCGARSVKKYPLGFALKDYHLYIGFVWDKELRSLLKTGDQVIAIEGVNCENTSLCDLITKEYLFKGKEKITITTKGEGGAIVETIIEKK